MNCTKRLRRAIDRDRARSGVFAATVMYRPCATSNFSSKEDLRHENAPRHSVFAPRRLATTRPALRAHRGCRRRRGVRRFTRPCIPFFWASGQRGGCHRTAGNTRANRRGARLVSPNHCAQERTAHPHPPSRGRVLLRREWGV